MRERKLTQSNRTAHQNREQPARLSLFGNRQPSIIRTEAVRTVTTHQILSLCTPLDICHGNINGQQSTDMCFTLFCFYVTAGSSWDLTFTRPCKEAKEQKWREPWCQQCKSTPLPFVSACKPLEFTFLSKRTNQIAAEEACRIGLSHII